MPLSRAYRFGGFTLTREDRALRKAGVRVPLGDKATALLFALVENNTKVIGKADLIRRLWPDGAADESTLRFHVASLRKALGDGDAGERYIVNVSGRGYCFVAGIDRQAQPTAAHGHGAPLFGRERALNDLQDLIARERFVSVVGAGGMGKSRLAFALVERQRERYADGVHVLDVAVITDPALVPTTLAHQLGVVYAPGEALAAVCRWFQDRHALLLLDSCESQIEACAALARALLERAAQVHVLTTSREALRVKGEWVLQLKPLATPAPPWAALTRDAVQSSPAVQLVLERIRLQQGDFDFSDADLPLVCELVTRLDGMPLAIELAAARLPGMTLRGLLDDLHSPQFLRRGATEGGGDGSRHRHRTLGELLDWSYERLPPDEQTVLRRLSVCNGAFTLETAQAVAADDTLGEAAAVEAVIGLEMQSLLAVDNHRPPVRFRLLDSTRAYAAARLGAADEYRRARIQQCVHLHDTMLRADADSPRLALPDWLQRYAPVNNDMRESIAWSLGPDGDAVRGIRLVAASVGFAHHLALAEEYSPHLARALDLLALLPQPEPEVEIALRGGQFVLHLLSRGPGSAMWSSHQRVLALADEIDSDKHRVEAINGLFVQAYFGHGDYPAAAAHADAVAALSSDAAPVSPLVNRLRLQALHGLGQHDSARRGLDAVLRTPLPRQRPRPPFPIDMAVMARMMLVRIHWLQGRADDALALLDELKALAARDVRFALANAYAWSICPLQFWRGDRDGARQAIEAMHQQAAEIDMPFTAAWACCYAQAWSRITGAPLALPSARLAVDEAAEKGVVSELLGSFDVDGVTPSLIERRRAGTLGWCAPEIARAEGVLLLRETGCVDEARALFDEALALARAHGALAWELRAATSLADLQLRAGKAGAARAVLEPVMDRFTQGRNDADFQVALAVLDGQPLPARYTFGTNADAATPPPGSPVPAAPAPAQPDSAAAKRP